VRFGGGIAALRVQHPDVSLEIVSGARPIDLQKGEADVAVRIGPIADENLVARKIGEATWALYAAAEYLKRVRTPVDVDDLTGHELIGFDKNMTSSPPAQWIDQHARGATIVLRHREMVDMRDAALHAVGIAVLPCALGDNEAKLVRLTKDAVAKRPISVVYRRDARLSSAVRAVVRMVVDVIGAGSW
jgi:DNA-binding transcriptional LysR family regulator